MPAKIWLNQGGHGDGANSGARQAAWRDALNRFWSHYLFGIDNGARTDRRRPYSARTGNGSSTPTGRCPERTTTLESARAETTPSANCELDIGSLCPAVAVEEVIVDDSTIDAASLVAAPQSPNRLVYQTTR